MISEDDFKDKAKMNLIDTCSMYLSIITVHKIVFYKPAEQQILVL